MLAVRSENTNCSNGMPMCWSTCSNQLWLAPDARCRLSALGRREASKAFNASSMEACEAKKLGERFGILQAGTGVEADRVVGCVGSMA